MAQRQLRGSMQCPKCKGNTRGSGNPAPAIRGDNGQQWELKTFNTAGEEEREGRQVQHVAAELRTQI